MPAYQGRAFQAAPPRRRPGRLRKVGHVLALIAVVTALAHVPWRELRRRVAVVGRVEIEGLRYLDAGHVMKRAGIAPGMDLLTLDLAGARQRLLADSRIAEARTERRWPRGVRVRIRERLPVLLIRHGLQWEMDERGVLLKPLREGQVADAPLLSGVSLETFEAGTCVGTRKVQRGIAWARAISARELEIAGKVSEIDVSGPRSTGLLLTNGTRVLSPEWPPGLRRLSALRVVLADLKLKQMLANEVDLRFEERVFVTPAPGSAPVAPAGAGTTMAAGPRKS